MSNRLFQGVIHQMKDAVDRTFGVIDENFTVRITFDESVRGTTKKIDVTLKDECSSCHDRS